VAARLTNYSNVLGYEIMNEPLPGLHLNFFEFSAKFLYPFYARVIQAITGVRDGLPTCPSNAPTGTNCAYPDLGVGDQRHLFFMEPCAIRNQLDFSLQFSKPVSSYPGTVYAPHVYTHVFTIDATLHLNISYPPSYDFAYVTALSDAKAMRSAMLVTEFGNSASDDDRILSNATMTQEKYLTSALVWSWKSNCRETDPHGCDWSWTVYQTGYPQLANGSMPQNGALFPSRQLLLSRVHPRGVVGELLYHRYDTASGSYVLTAQCNSTSCASAAYPSLLYIPRTVTGAVFVSGVCSTPVVTMNPDGSRVASIFPTGAEGLYSIGVAASEASFHNFRQRTAVIRSKEAKEIVEAAGNEVLQAQQELALSKLQSLYTAAVKIGNFSNLFCIFRMLLHLFLCGARN